MTDNIIKTEIQLSEESVHKIVVSETAKAVAKIPNLLETFVNSILFSRPKKRNSYDPEPSTFFELAIQNTFKPMIEEEVRKLAQQHRKKLSGIISNAFKSKIIDNKEFENKIIERLSKFSSNISFYVDDRK